jgi:hypothetical protein
MGGCCSDARGGMQGVGDGPQGAGTAGPSSQSEANAALDHFFNSRGMRGLYIPLEVFKFQIQALLFQRYRLIWDNYEVSDGIASICLVRSCTGCN